LYASVVNAAYLPQTSAGLGAAHLREWHAELLKEAARQRSRTRPADLTPVQLGVANYPLYAVAVATAVPRNADAEYQEIAARLNPDGGEYCQVDYGRHAEFAQVPVTEGMGIGGAAPAGTPALITIDGKTADAFAAAGFSAPPPIYDQVHEVRLYTTAPDTESVATDVWRLLDVYKLQPGERVLSMKEVPGPMQLGKFNTDGVLLIGTGFVTIRGEETAAQGRLIALRVDLTQQKDARGVPIVDADGKPVPPAPKFRCLMAVEPPVPTGAVMSVAAFAAGQARRLVLGVGQQVQVVEWRPPRELNPGQIAAGMVPTADEIIVEKIGFATLPTWVASVAATGQQILAGDLTRSFSLFAWREEDRSLNACWRDLAPLPVSTVGFVAHEVFGPVPSKFLGLFIADADGNAQIMNYKNQNMVLAADFHVSAMITATVSTRAAVPAALPANQRGTFGLVTGTVDSRVGMFLPLDDLPFRRLLALQTAMALLVPQAAGLAPASFRLFTSPADVGRPCAKNLLDGAFLALFPSLDMRTQRALAKVVGVPVDHLLESLRQVQLACQVF
jgi:hypothetical protein